MDRLGMDRLTEFTLGENYHNA